MARAQKKVCRFVSTRLPCRLLATAMLAHRNLRFCLFQRRCYVNTYATQPLQASCSALHCGNDKVFRLRPKRKPIQSALINGMCDFKDVTKPPTASLWSGLFTFTHSRDTYTRTLSIRSVLINGMCNFEDGTRAATAASK